MNIIVALALTLAGCSGSSTSSSSTGNPGVVVSSSCCGWETQNSPGTTITQAATGVQFAFPTNPNHVNIFVTGIPGTYHVNETMTATFHITGSNPQFAFVPEAGNTCGGPATMNLYLQQAGDNFSGAGAYQYYRWWSAARQTLAVGNIVTWAVELDPSLWSSVLGANGASSAAATAGFQTAIANIQLAGVTFGGGCFDGHGAWLNGGNATFNMRGFSIQ